MRTSVSWKLKSFKSTVTHDRWEPGAIELCSMFDLTTLGTIREFKRSVASSCLFVSWGSKSRKNVGSRSSVRLLSFFCFDFMATQLSDCINRRYRRLKDLCVGFLHIFRSDGHYTMMVIGPPGTTGWRHLHSIDLWICHHHTKNSMSPQGPWDYDWDALDTNKRSKPCIWYIQSKQQSIQNPHLQNFKATTTQELAFRLQKLTSPTVFPSRCTS